MKNRILSSLLASLMLVTALSPLAAAVDTARCDEACAASAQSIASFAACDDAYREMPQPVELDGGLCTPKEQKYLASYDYSSEYAILRELEGLIVSKMKPGKFTLDVSQYKIDPDVINLYSVMYYSPYIANGISIIPYYYSGGYYSHIEVTCPLNRYEIESYYDRVDSAIADACAALERADNDMERTLMLHDYLAYSAEYDAERLDNGTIPDDSYSSAGVLVHKIGVCQSYAYAYKYILDRYGIESCVVSSSAMNHAWNIVRIGNGYYHVDVTWDDPVGDALGRVSHTFFLLSDSAVQSSRGGDGTAHYGWKAEGRVCADTYYDDAYWCGIETPIYIYGDYRYFIDDGYLVKRQAYTGEQYALDTFDRWYTSDGSAYWIGVFSGLSYYRDRLFYNTPHAVKYLELSSGQIYTLRTASFEANTLYYSKIEGDTLYYIFSDSPYTDGVSWSWEICELTSIKTLDVSSSDVLLWEGDSFDLNVRIMNLEGTDYVNYTINDSTVVDFQSGWNIVGKAAGGTSIELSYGDAKKDIYVYVLNSSKLFRDVKSGSWFRGAVDYAVKSGLMNGMSHYDFEPNTTMSRAMLVTVLWRMSGSPEPVGKAPFGDLKQSWYKKAVAWAYENGVVNGISATSFGPDESVTREQMAAIFYRYSALCGFDVSQSGDISGYPDAGRVSKYAVSAMRWASGVGLIKGQSTSRGNMLSPRGEATRAEVATMLQRFAALGK